MAVKCRDAGKSRYPSPSGFHFCPICCRSKTTFPAASKVLRLPQQKVPRCGHPMSLHQTPYVFSLKTCAPTRYTPVYPPDTHLCTHLIHTCAPKAPPPRYGTFEIGYGTLIELSSDFLKLIRDFEVCDTRLSRPRYRNLPVAIPDFAVRDLRP